MPEGAKDKQERQYEHIKESYKRRGKDEDKAEEIAARTVNKERREKGQTENKKTQGTGNPNVPYEGRSKDELINLAKDKGLEGPTTMNKDELVKALRKAS